MNPQPSPPNNCRAQNTATLKTLLFIILSLAIANPTIALTLTITAPSQVLEGDQLTLAFTSTPPAQNYAIYKDGTLVSTNTTYTWQTNYSSAGEYLFLFNATNPNETKQESRVVKIVDNPLTLTLNSPPETKTNADHIFIDATTSRPVTSCTYQLGVQSGQLDSQGTHHTKTIGVFEGIQTLTVTCNDEYDTAQAERTFIIDKTPPTITTITPASNQEITSNYATLAATTDEVATCKYGTLNAPYDNLPSTFAITGSLNHQTPLDNLAQGGHTFFIACKDAAGNPSTTTERFFRVNTPPSASITIDGEEPLRQGRYRVRLQASEDLAQTPSLTYHFEDDPKPIEVALTGEDANWEGYIIIDKQTTDNIGSFTFRGIDNTGLEGTHITSGKLFLVDTKQPGKILSFTAQNKSNYIELKWVYDGESPQAFHIFRSPTPGVDYIDKYAEVTPRNSTEDGLIYETYRDYAVKDAVTYYYRIAALDEANNIGELSEEQSASAVIAEAQAAEERISPVFEVILDKEVRSVERSLADVESAILSLQTEKSPGAAQLVNDLDLLTPPKAAKARLESLREKLLNSKTLALDKQAFDTLITQARQERESALQDIVDDITIESRGDYIQALDSFQLQEGIAAFKKGTPIPQEFEEEFIRNAKALQERTSIQATIVSGTLRYLDGTKKPITLIKKTLTSSEAIPKGYLIESIPKNLAQTTDQITFFTPPTIIEKDPIVQYNIADLQTKTITYTLPRLATLPEARATRTYVLPAPSKQTKQEGEINQETPTGAATFTSKEKPRWTNYLILILGGAAVAILLIYYLFFPGQDPQLSDPFKTPPPGTTILPTKRAHQQNHFHQTSPLAPARQGATPNQTSQAKPPATTNLKPRNLTTTLPGEILTKLNAATHLINQNMVDQAVAAYKELLAINYATIPQQLRRHIKGRLEELYNKIQLATAIKKGHAYLGKQDFLNLSRTIEEIKQLAQTIPKENTYLTSHAEASYTYFNEQLFNARLVSETKPTMAAQKGKT
ncbi:hypothetical protein D6783_01340 [Candidatus Woesearchaeota archaeon]|nr:MAG: hypothetical protein D6783_01340 [Candidatus Woesearchaeota archaeon]